MGLGLWFRSDTWTRNTKNAYQLGTSNSASDSSLDSGGGACVLSTGVVNGYIREVLVDVLHTDGSVSNLGGLNVWMSHSSGPGTWDDTYTDVTLNFNCPATTIVPSDCLYITIKASAEGNQVDAHNTAYWVSDYLRMTELKAATWVFTGDWRFYGSTSFVAPYGYAGTNNHSIFLFGGSTNPAGIGDIDFTASGGFACVI